MDSYLFVLCALGMAILTTKGDSSTPTTTMITATTNPTSGSGTTTNTEPSSVETCVDKLGNGLYCAEVPNVCSNLYGKVLYTTSVDPSSVETCLDTLGNGLHCTEVPNVCFNLYGKLLCQRTCKLCSPNPNAVTQPPSSTASSSIGGCVDHVINGLKCAELPSVCVDDLGKIFCPQHCGLCGTSTATTTKTTVNATAHIPTDTTSADPSSVETCVDTLGNGLHCTEVPNVCSNIYGKLLCRRTCKLCSPNPNAVTQPPSSTASSSIGGCVDHVINGLKCAELPSVCVDDLGKIFCPQHCGLCGQAPAATSESTTGLSTQFSTDVTTRMTTTHQSTATSLYANGDCMDNIGMGLHCQQINGICHDPYASFLCPATCGYCTAPTGTRPPVSTTSPPSLAVCTDHVINKWTCANLPLVCSDPLAPVICPKTCGRCANDTTPTTNMSTITPRATTTTATDTTTSTTNLTTTTPPTTATATATTTSMTNLTTITPLPPTTATSTKTPMTNLTTITKAAATATATTTIMTSSSSIPVATTLPSTSTDHRPHYGDCIDHVGNGMQCSMYSGVCQDSFSLLLCAKFCGFCVPSSDPSTVEPTSSSSTASPDVCADRVTYGLTCRDIPHLCASHYGKMICPQTCNTCDYLQQTKTTVEAPTTPTTTTPTTTATTTTPRTPTRESTVPVTTTVAMTTEDHGACSDNVGLGLSCDALPGACNDPLAPVICKKSCGFCDCQDKIVGMTCQDLIDVYDVNPCTDQLGHQVCSKFCGFC